MPIVATDSDLLPQRKSDSRAEPAEGKKRAGWKFCAALALLALFILNWASVFPQITSRDHQGTQDFSIFYTGSRIVLGGLSSSLYDLSVQARYQTPPYQSKPLPLDHPAYELLLFLPLGALSFNAAFWSWIAVNLALAVIAVRLLSPHLPNFSPPSAEWALAAAAASFPLIWSLCQGQDSILLLLVFVSVYVSLKSGKDWVAGVLLAAGLFKFTLVVPFLIPFLLRRRWRFLGGFLSGAVCAVGISVLITGLSGARQYVQLLSLLAANPSIGYINLFLMPNVRGFLLTMVAGHGVHRQAFEISAGIVSAFFLIVPVLTFGGLRQFQRLDLWFALNLTISALVSPHLYWHDLTILLLPILLVANALLKSDLHAFPVAAAITGAVLYASAWPVWPPYLPILRNVAPSYFFLPLCLFAVWLALQVWPRRLEDRLG